jgi:hypothetical protein
MRNMNSSSAYLQKDANATAKFANIIKNSKGTLNISVKDSPAITVALGSNRIALDIRDPSIFGNVNLEKQVSDGFFEKLRALRWFGEMLNSNGLTLTVSRKGKEAFTLGRDATPILSSIITGSDDMHIDSISQVTKLSQDVRKSKKK